MKYAAKIIIIIAIFAIGFFFGQSNPGLFNYNEPNPEENSVSEPSTITASLMVDFGDGQIQTFNNIELAEETSVFDFLKKVSEDNNLELKYQDFGEELGVMVEKIGDKENNFDKNHYWQYWINNSYAKVGASQMKLNNHDNVEWKYTMGQLE